MSGTGPGAGGAAPARLGRLGLTLAARQWPRFLFFAACLSLGVGFLTAVSHLLHAVDRAVAARARELLAGDLELASGRPFSAAERAAFAAEASAPGRRTAESVTFASMLSRGGGAPFLVSVKVVDAAYPLRGALVTEPPGGTALLAGGGKVLLERAAALQNGLKVGARVRLGARDFAVAGLIEREPDRGFGGFAFAPRLMLARGDLDATGLLGLGARTRYKLTLALDDAEDPVTGAKAARARLEAALPEPHLQLSSYADGEPSVSDGLRRSSLFFTVLALTALLLGAAGLRAGLTLFLDAQAGTMGLLRCLGASAAEVERLYASLCAGAGLAGGLLGALLGWAVAAGAAALAPRFGVDLTVPPSPAAFAEAVILSVALAWGLSAARVRALASRSPLDALRAPPAPSPALVRAGWAAAAGAVALAAWTRAGSATEAAKLTAALALGALAVELLSRLALKAAGASARVASRAGLALPVRHGLRRLTRRPDQSRVMLFTLAGGFAMLAAVGTAREGLTRTLALATDPAAPDTFLVDIQPSQLERVRGLVASRAAGEAAFSPLVRARLTAVDGRAARRGPRRRAEERERGRWRAREYNLTYAAALNPAETVTAGRFWDAAPLPPGAAPLAEASVEKDFLDRAGIRLGSTLTFDISGREVRAKVTSVREVRWTSMRPNFFVTLHPSLLENAPRTFIASFRARSAEDSAGLREDLARAAPNISAIDAGALLSRVQETLGLLLTAVGALAGFCVAVGALVVAGLVALSREERAADAALERALGWTARETLVADAAELGMLGALSALSAAAASVLIGWAVAQRLKVPFAADPREAALLAAAALVLPLAAGLLAGLPGRRDAVMDALRRDA